MSAPARDGTVKRRPKVAVVYKSLPQYRRAFFELLRIRLDDMGMEFMLIYGQPGWKDSTKKDTVDLAWAHKVQNRFIRLAGRELYWQPVLALLKDVDLVIVEQASKLLVNYVLQAQYLLGGRKFAFWGHGKNFQGHEASRLGEAIKRAVSCRAHWWFTYNDISTKVVTDLGFPSSRITSVQNAIDTRSLIETRTRTERRQLDALRAELGVQGGNVCIFASGMYAEKRLHFLLEACSLIRAQVPDFEMIFIGAGPDDAVVKRAAKEHRWVHYVGPKFDAAKVPYFMVSKLFLMPGLVGLGVLDAFALEVPLVTTNVHFHSPEIEYLVNGRNGVILEDASDPNAYAAVVTRLLRDEHARQVLVAGCRESAALYTVEEMVSRFASGVAKALEA